MRCRTVAGLLLVAAALPVGAENRVRPFAGSGAAPMQPWRFSGLPQQTLPSTTFTVVDLDGERALRIEADGSYGNLVHPLQYAASSAHLSWRWRADRLIDTADLRTKAGDDTAVKVCVFFDLAIDGIPFVERQLLRLARSRSQEPLPGATICYVWDAHLPVGTVLDNAYTRRMRYLVVRSGTPGLGRWTAERRDVEADFLSVFGDEADRLPPIVGVALGADADNTGSRSLAHVATLALQP